MQDVWICVVSGDHEEIDVYASRESAVARAEFWCSKLSDKYHEIERVDEDTWTDENDYSIQVLKKTIQQ